MEDINKLIKKATQQIEENDEEKDTTKDINV